MYKVQKESNSTDIKTLHRNMLLPFSAIPMTSQTENSFPQSSNKKLIPGKVTQKPVVQTVESESSSDSEQEESVPVPRYVPPHRRRPSGAPKHSSITSVSRGNSSISRSQGQNEDSNVSHFTDSSSTGLSARNSLPSSSVQGSGSAGTLNSTSDISSVSTPPSAPPQPRRSGRNRQAPERFGDWIYQHTVDNPDTVEYFV